MVTIATNGWEPRQKPSNKTIDEVLQDLEYKMKIGLVCQVQVLVSWVVVFEM